MQTPTLASLLQDEIEAGMHADRSELELYLPTAFSDDKLRC